MKKIMTIVGTRPEIIKLSRVIYEIEKYAEHTLVHTGQNHDYELNEIFFKDLEIRKPDEFLEAVGSSVAQTIGNIIAKSDAVIDKYNPDAVLLGDDEEAVPMSDDDLKKAMVPVDLVEEELTQVAESGRIRRERRRMRARRDDDSDT